MTHLSIRPLSETDLREIIAANVDYLARQFDAVAPREPSTAELRQLMWKAFEERPAILTGILRRAIHSGDYVDKLEGLIRELGSHIILPVLKDGLAWMIDTILDLVTRDFTQEKIGEICGSELWCHAEYYSGTRH